MSIQRDVGVLHVVLSQHGTPVSKVHRFIREAAASSRQIRQINAKLPTALATNLLKLPNATRSAWSIVRRHTTSREVNVWANRLRAVAASPFELTLALDTHATVCSPALHAALLREHALNRLDFAFNFEASTLTPTPSSVLGSRPSRVEDISPHLFAMLVRKGEGLDRLLLHIFAAFDLRVASGGVFGLDDQEALQHALRTLRKQGYQSCEANDPIRPGDFYQIMRTNDPPKEAVLRAAGSLDSWRGALQDFARRAYYSTLQSNRLDCGHDRCSRWRRLWCRWRRRCSLLRSCDTSVRVFRLRENIGAFKRADYRREGTTGPARWVWPIYTRPWRGPLLVLHSYHANALAGREVCSIFNPPSSHTRMNSLGLRNRTRASTHLHGGERMALQLSPTSPIITPTRRSECLHAAVNTRAETTQQSIYSTEHARRICAMLPAKSQPQYALPAAVPELAEPLDQFWGWMVAQGLTSGA